MEKINLNITSIKKNNPRSWRNRVAVITLYDYPEQNILIISKYYEEERLKEYFLRIPFYQVEVKDTRAETLIALLSPDIWKVEEIFKNFYEITRK